MRHMNVDNELYLPLSPDTRRGVSIINEMVFLLLYQHHIQSSKPVCKQKRLIGVENITPISKLEHQ